jgi:hypothetical protein
VGVRPLTTITIGSRRETDAHPALVPGGPDLAVAATLEPDGLVARVSFRCDAALAAALGRPVEEAVALLVDLPDLGRGESSLLTDGERLGGGGEAPGGVAEGTLEGWVTARVRLDPALPRPTTLYLRAALRDACSAPLRIELPSP